MKKKSLSNIFNTGAYLSDKLDDIDSLSGYRNQWMKDGESGPKFDIYKIYSKYFRQAQSGEITSEIIFTHDCEVLDDTMPFEVDPKNSVAYIANGPTIRNRFPVGEFNIFTPLTPMVKRFALYAALSNASLKDECEADSIDYLITAAEIWGSIDRLRNEFFNIFFIQQHSVIPHLFEEEKALVKKFDDWKKGGDTKGDRARELAVSYWDLCVKHPKYAALLIKHPRMGEKFSDSIYDLINPEAETKDIKKIPYGKAWFHKNVTKKFGHPGLIKKLS